MAKTIQSTDSKNMRDLRIDVMRVVGLLMIILAHVNPPGFIFQLKNFNVPLKVAGRIQNPSRKKFILTIFTG